MLSSEKRQNLYEVVVKERHRNLEINHVRKLNEIAAIIEHCNKDEDKKEESEFID
ncbi:hypothetical protein [Wolbachia pipientis]|uniref:hypothetical protein n=1 Tax=Wolbachia pipientis TaxID=955 RepID=UPI0025A4361A|nr:hypothetical protein [Wolbachia pipientis]MDM8335094.1 hypothetical protein [Wolbachia pipientis]